MKDTIPLGLAMAAVGHAATACTLKYLETQDVREWLDGSFRKVVCKVNEKEFEKAKEFDDRIVVTEMALDKEETAIAFKPRSVWPKAFRFYQLYK